MKALVYHGEGNISWEEHPDPEILAPTDVIMRVDTTTICGTDLHIWKGDMPEVEDGRILGHEGVGTILEVGEDVKEWKVGDRAIISCVSACGKCEYCKKGLTSHCMDPEGAEGIGWIFGYMIDGTQAEKVRVPFADTSLYRIPEGVMDEQGVMVSDILPTGYEIGIRDGGVKEGDTIAVIGAGPVGLAAMMTSSLNGAKRVIAIDFDENRLEQAKEKFGATDSVNAADEDWREQVLAMTDGGLGVDVACEAVGVPVTLQNCFKIIRPGGQVANIGVHGAPVEIEMNKYWIMNIRLSMGLVNAVEGERLLGGIKDGKFEAENLVTHRFAMEDMMEAYETFRNAKETKAMKVIITQ